MLRRRLPSYPGVTLGVNGKTVAEHAPEADFVGMPRLTVPMVARIQGFPDDWHFTGRKTAAYRQVGNAFPPPVARAVGENVRATSGWRSRQELKASLLMPRARAMVETWQPRPANSSTRAMPKGVTRQWLRPVSPGSGGTSRAGRLSSLRSVMGVSRFGLSVRASGLLANEHRRS